MLSTKYGTPHMLELYMRGGKAMSMDRLTQVGEGLVKRFGTRDPLEIAEDIGIEVLYCDTSTRLAEPQLCGSLWCGRSGNDENAGAKPAAQ